MKALDSVMAEALALPSEQRALLVDRLLAGLDATGIKHIDRLLRQEAALGRREDLGEFLAAVPDREPAESDRILPASNEGA